MNTDISYMHTVPCLGSSAALTTPSPVATCLGTSAALTTPSHVATCPGTSGQAISDEATRALKAYIFILAIMVSCAVVACLPWGGAS